MREQFEVAYQQRYAFLMPRKKLIAEAISVEAIGLSDAPIEKIDELEPRNEALRAAEAIDLFSGGAWHNTGLYRRTDMRQGDVVDGQAVNAEKNATTVVQPGWRATVPTFKPWGIPRPEALTHGPH